MSGKRNVDWAGIEVEYCTTERPVLQIANEFGVTEGGIRARAKKYGWVRNMAAQKRAEVERRLNGITKYESKEQIRTALENAADMDAADMLAGLDVARACIRRLRQSVELTEDPKDIKVIAEANRVAIDTIRRIRGLDEKSDAAVLTIERAYG
jgi:hypothetical protein